MSDQPVIKIDTTAIAKTMEDRFKALEKNLEEKLTPKSETKGLTEVKGATAPSAFDYRPGITNILKSFRERIGPDNYEGRRSVEDIAIRTEAQKGPLQDTQYSLKESFIETIGTVSPTCCIPEIWADKIERDHIYPGSIFLGAWFMNWYDEIKGKPGDSVNICRVGPATCVDLECDEPSTTAATVTCPQITLEHDACAYTICREDIEDVQVGLVDALNEGLGSCLAVCIDNYFFGVALACANRGTYTHTGRMTGSLIAEAMATMEAGNLRKWIKVYSAHTYMPIENKCRESVHPKKRHALIVGPNGKAPHVKGEHVALTVGSILFSIMKGIENTLRIGEEENPSYSEKDPTDRIYGYQTYMRNLGNHVEIGVIYVELRKKDLSSTILNTPSIHIMPFGLETTLRSLSFLGWTVTLLLIGLKKNGAYPTQNLRVDYPFCGPEPTSRRN